MDIKDKKEIDVLKERLLKACVKFETLIESDVFSRDAKAIDDVRKTLSDLRANLAEMIDRRFMIAVDRHAAVCFQRFKNIEGLLAKKDKSIVDYKSIAVKAAVVAAVTTTVSIVFGAVIVFIDMLFGFGVVKFFIKML